MQKGILVIISMDDENKELFRKEAGQYPISFKPRKETTAADLNNVCAVIGSADPAILKDAKDLKWLHTQSAGVDRYVKKGVLPKGVTLTNSAGAYSEAIAEYLVASVFSIFKNFHLYRDQQAKSEWKAAGPAKSVSGSSVLVVGAGSIGRAFASRMKSLGAYVAGVRRKNAQKEEFFDEMHLIDDLDNVLPRFDTVAVCLPGTADTAGLFDARRLSLMKDGSVFINIGRGNIANLEALNCALKKNLLGAVLDVTDPEPLPDDSPLWGQKNLILTPHISGIMKTSDEMVIKIARDNLRRFVAGEELSNIVDKTAGY